MSNKPKLGFMAQNPERVMIFIFPLITLSLFIVAAFLWWVITTQILH
jgi:hypothetical protein